MSTIIQPLVSIITPCYNVENYIEEYLDSLLSQTYDNIEVILINDGSTDRTEEIIKLYEDKIKKRGYKFIYIYQKNSGQAAALNKGLPVFKGEYFTWPDADDILSDDNIETKVSFLEKNSEYDLVRGKRRFFEKDVNQLNDREKDIKLEKEDIFYDLFLEKTFCNGGCYLMTRDLFLRCYIDRTIYAGLGSQNWQLLVPAASRSKCGNINQDIFFIRLHQNSFSRRKRTLEEWFLRFDDHKNLLFDSFNHSNCDEKKCRKIVEEKYARRKLHYAFNYEDKEAFNKQFMWLKEKNLLSKEEVLKNIIIKYKLTYFVFGKMRSIYTYIKNIIRNKSFV